MPYKNSAAKRKAKNKAKATANNNTATKSHKLNPCATPWYPGIGFDPRPQASSDYKGEHKIEQFVNTTAPTNHSVSYENQAPTARVDMTYHPLRQGYTPVYHPAYGNSNAWNPYGQYNAYYPAPFAPTMVQSAMPPNFNMSNMNMNAGPWGPPATEPALGTPKHWVIEFKRIYNSLPTQAQRDEFMLNYNLGYEGKACPENIEPAYEEAYKFGTMDKSWDSEVEGSAYRKQWGISNEGEIDGVRQFTDNCNKS